MSRNSRRTKNFKQGPVLGASKNIRRRTTGWPNASEIATRENSMDWGGFIQYLPNPDPILTKLGRDMTVYNEIIQDPHLTSVIASRKAGVKSMLWDIDRGKSKSRQAKAVKEIFEHLDVYRIINDTLDYFLTGLAPLEVMWARPNKMGLIMPFEVMGKPAEWFMFNGNNVLKFRSKNKSIEGEDLPPRKILLPRHNPTYKNPYGESLLSTVYWPVIFKMGGLKFWLKYTEKYGMPLATGKVPRTAQQEEFDQMAEMLLDFIQDSAVAIPDDSSIELLSDSGKKASMDLYKGLADFCNAEISKAVLGHASVADATPGKLGNDDIPLEVRKEIINEDKRVVETCMNQLVTWIMEINYGTNLEMPKFTMYQEQDIEKERSDRDKTLSDTGQVIFTQQYIDSAYGFKKGDVIVKEPEEPEKKDPEEKEKTKKEFAEQARMFKDEKAVDNLINAQTDEELQKQVKFMEPIFKVFDDADNYQDAMKKLSSIFTELDSSRLEEVLKRAIFVTEVWGRLNQDA